jgi:hypothetical protein
MKDDTKNMNEHTIDNGDKYPTLSSLLSQLISSPESTVITTMNATTENPISDDENTQGSTKAVFFDLGGPSMGDRIHLWLAYRPEISSRYVETRIITANYLQSPEYGAINPMRKAPALIRQDGATVYEVAGEDCADECSPCVLRGSLAFGERDLRVL